MTVNVDVMREVAEKLYVAMVVREHGANGAVVLRQLLEAIHLIYRHVEPETLQSRLIVFKTLDDSHRPLDITSAMTVRRIESLPVDVVGPSIIQVLSNGDLLVWRETEVSPPELAVAAVVYQYESRNERFFAKLEDRPVPRLSVVHASVFSNPTFGDLRQALETYRTRLARVSTCEILSAAWFDSNRLHFRAKPEATMRRSLTQFLVSVLRNAEVRPEQIVDESHPVDIKVTWMLTNRLALIEIKWLGESKHPDGSDATGYSASRAVDGAKQLAHYLDANHRRAADNLARGYLVVFDGRRRGLASDATTIARDKGMWYQTDDVTYVPRYHETRDDFEEPIRFFLEPVYA
jgi:hypothetical protein